MTRTKNKRSASLPSDSDNEFPKSKSKKTESCAEELLEPYLDDPEDSLSGLSLNEYLDINDLLFRFKDKKLIPRYLPVFEFASKQSKLLINKIQSANSEEKSCELSNIESNLNKLGGNIDVMKNELSKISKAISPTASFKIQSHPATYAQAASLAPTAKNEAKLPSQTKTIVIRSTSDANPVNPTIMDNKEKQKSSINGPNSQNFQYCRIEHQVLVKQCQNCYQYGHKKGDCKNTAVCRNCGGSWNKNHQCENPNLKCCINCKNHIHHQNETNHSSNSELCPIYTSQMKRTGIFINNKNLMAKKLDKYTNCWMTTVQVQLSKSLLIISNVYIEPNTISSSHIDLLKDLMKTFANHPLILSGDLNARHTLWHDRIINRHGESICELINDFDLHIHNDESPTCLTINGNSIIDLTLSNYKARSFIRNWASTVHQHSIFDHALIEFEYASNERIPQRISNTTRRFNERKADWTKFNELIDQESVARITQNIEHTNDTNTIDHNILELTRIIQKAAFNSMPTIKRSTYHKRSNWWDTELKMMQIVFNSKRYLFSKERNPEARQHLYDDFKSFRNKYVITTNFGSLFDTIYSG
ncbi:hypothetical protein SSS_00314 [Sarcoptes scabiei]|uniref:Endonuclease/exonuclease/phosphatase domain-containing protein n=1 Tax=Sarcoptes scabiei TaxID=52283 RepID=A0A834RFL6_SARSC|nr:hypothetical protein SSS_00314 [Sarcoptes scabiei]